MKNKKTTRVQSGLYINGHYHKHKKNIADRQTCCKYCHKCGGQLRTVLDGELWCSKCERYW